MNIPTALIILFVICILPTIAYWVYTLKSGEPFMDKHK